MDPVFTGTKGRSARGLVAWMVFATSSFPVPLSPRIKTVARVGATWVIRSITFCMGSLLPTMLGNAKRFKARRSWTFSSCKRDLSSVLRISSSTRSLSQGLVM